MHHPMPVASEAGASHCINAYANIDLGISISVKQDRTPKPGD